MRAAMRALLPDFSRLSLKSATGAHNNPPDDDYDPNWVNMPNAEKQAVIELLRIQQEEKRSPDVGGATTTKKNEWFKGTRYWRQRLSHDVLTHFGKFPWYEIDELKNHPRIPWYWGDEDGRGGNHVGLEAGQNSQGGQYGKGVLNPLGNWGPDHSDAW